MDIAKYLVAIVTVFNFGGLVADALVPATARQHLWNPVWPPHAKFHNAQTMLMGLFGGALALGILFLSRPLTLPLFLLATAIAASYFVAMALAQAFPGTAWTDPEFAAGTPRPLGLGPQQLRPLRAHRSGLDSRLHRAGLGEPGARPSCWASGSNPAMQTSLCCGAIWWPSPSFSL